MPGYPHLTLPERERIARERAQGRSWRAIARALGRAPSTITREVTRHALPQGGYRPVYAEGCYLERRQRPAVLERDAKLRRFVTTACLKAGRPSRSPAGSTVARSVACGRFSC